MVPVTCVELGGILNHLSFGLLSYKIGTQSPKLIEKLQKFNKMVMKILGRVPGLWIGLNVYERLLSLLTYVLYVCLAVMSVQMELRDDQ